MTAEKRHFYFLDLLRIFALASIILFHFVEEQQAQGTFLFYNKGITLSNPNVHIATMGVSLFFMISGAGLMASSRQDFCPKDYYLKRFLRIYIPFYIAYAGYLAYYLLRLRHFPWTEKIAPWKFLFTLTATDEYANLHGITTFSLGIGEWFLGCLILIYLLFPLLRFCMIKNCRLTMAAATALYVLLVCNYRFAMPVHMNFLLKLYEFLLGMFMIRCCKRLHNPAIPLVSLLVILLFLCFPKTLPLPEAFRITLFSAALFLAAAYLEPLLGRAVFLQKTLSFLCAYSYELYLVHHAVIYQCGECFRGRQYTLPEIMLIFLMELLVMAFFAFIIKKIHQKICRKIKRGNTCQLPLNML